MTMRAFRRRVRFYVGGGDTPGGCVLANNVEPPTLVCDSSPHIPRAIGAPGCPSCPALPHHWIPLPAEEEALLPRSGLIAQMKQTSTRVLFHAKSEPESNTALAGSVIENQAIMHTLAYICRIVQNHAPLTSFANGAARCRFPLPVGDSATRSIRRACNREGLD